MSATYVVTAGAVTAETLVGAGRAAVDFHRGARLPDDVPAEQIETLLRLGHIKVVTEAVTPTAAATAGDEVPTGTVADVLAWVGDDRDRAAAALEAERAGKGRKSLIEQLEQLLAAE